MSSSILVSIATILKGVIQAKIRRTSLNYNILIRLYIYNQLKRHSLGYFVFDVLNRSHGVYAAIHQDNAFRAKGVYLVHVMGGEQDGLSLLGHLVDNGPNVTSRGGINSRAGLIQANK